MNRPSKFEIMRARRTAKPKKKVEAQIDEAEAEVERLWDEMRRAQLQERQQRFDNTADWVSDTRRQALEREKREPEPGLARVLLHIVASLPRAAWRSITRRCHRTA